MSSNSPPIDISEARDWTSLPPELLHHISEYLLQLNDLISFRSVCPNWRTSAITSLSQLPWLLNVPGSFPHRKPSQTGDLQFYSLITKKVHTVTVPETKGKIAYGPGHRYIITSADNWTHNYLLNPITGNKISLPILPYGYLKYKPFSICNTEYIGYHLNPETWGVIFSRRHTEVDWKIFPLPWNKVTCSTLYKGKYYIYQEEDESQDLRVVDMATGSTELIVVLPHESPEKNFGSIYNYLIGSSEGLLRVSKQGNKFRVYVVDLDCKNPRWIKKNSIGDVMLFLNFHNGLYFNARDFSGFTGNCIYFIKYSYFWPSTDNYYNVFKYCLEDGRTEVVTEPIKGDGSWFMPSL